MKNKRIFRLVTTLFWVVFAVLIALDTINTKGYRVEPAPIALGSGQAASGGHCSGR
jgi:hypothetical protein